MTEFTKEQIEAYEREQQVEKEFNDYRAKIAKDLPSLASRVFALRSKSYPGCGFHYSMEARLGYVIQHVNNFGETYGFVERVMFEVQVSSLYDSVKEAEDYEG